MDGTQEQRRHKEAAQLASLLQERLLTATDWIEGCGQELCTNAWIEYREELRRVPLQSGWPHAINWPKPPRAA